MATLTIDYGQFLADKSQWSGGEGLRNVTLPDYLFDFQKYLTDWALRMGRSAIFADCGLGKSAIELAWGNEIVRQTNKPVLLVTPLAVGYQMLKEADKFGIEAERSRDGKISGSKIWITNYEQLHKFDPSQFIGMIGDESSAIKNYKGERKKVVVEFMRRLPFRLLCTATAAPNDFWELGTSSEALGVLGFRDMITTFFKQETQQDYLGWGRTKYRFRGHAEQPFWSWVCSWARSLRMPSDMGFSDEGYVLPPLQETEYVVDTKKARDGMLFAMSARNLQEQRDERRNSIDERCEMARKLTVKHDGPTVLWCELNAEGDRLAKEIPNAVQVSGSMSDDQKEEILIGFTKGEIERLVTKPKIGCWGLNWQHCHNVVMFPSHSYEQYYQAVRRCLRFGQENAVKCHLIVNEGEVGVLKNIRRKADQAERMFSSLVKHMNDSYDHVERNLFRDKEQVPSWL